MSAAAAGVQQETNVGAQNNRLSRIIMAYRLENIDVATAKFVDVLGIQDMEGPEDLLAVGLRVAISWETGIEIIAPLASGAHSAHIRQYIDSHGEGLFGVVYQVADLDAADRRAAAHGHPSRARLDPFEVNPGWRKRFSYLMESPLTPVAGVEMTLIQIGPRGTS